MYVRFLESSKNEATLECWSHGWQMKWVLACEPVTQSHSWGVPHVSSDISNIRVNEVAKFLGAPFQKHQDMQPPLTDKWWKWLRCTMHQAGIRDLQGTSPPHCPPRGGEIWKDNAHPHSFQLVRFIPTEWLLYEMLWPTEQLFQSHLMIQRERKTAEQAKSWYPEPVQVLKDNTYTVHWRHLWFS